VAFSEIEIRIIQNLCLLAKIIHELYLRMHSSTKLITVKLQAEAASSRQIPYGVAQNEVVMLNLHLLYAWMFAYIVS